MSIERFANPSLLWLLVLLAPLAAYYIFRSRQGGATLQVSSTTGLGKIARTPKYYLRHLPFLLRCMTVALLVVALARPQSSQSNETSSTQGIDIMISLDISISMLARDFKPNRLVAAKEITRDFISGRTNDRIGLSVFAGESYTQSPLTTDKATLLNLLFRQEVSAIDNGTAIGNGLATAINRLKDSPAKSKVIILLTDGVNNTGQIAPLTAAEIAQVFGIRVYTIGVGTRGRAPHPALDRYGRTVYVEQEVEIDDQVLTEIAAMTGGKYYRATDNSRLQEIYEEIDRLERTEIEVDSYTRWYEKFMPFTLAAFLLLIVEMLLRYFYLRRIP